MSFPVSLPFAPRNPLPINSAFGKRPLYNDFHSGIDFNSTTGAHDGTAVKAAGTGTIVEAYNGNVPGASNWNKLRGTMVVIDHGGNVRTRYHMLQPNSFKPVGTRVFAGDTIGRVGKSGTSATGAHLHFELWIGGVAVNPLAHISYVPSQLTGSASKPFDNSTPKETDMKHIYHPDRGYALIWDEGAYGYPDDAIDAIVAKGIEPSIKYDYSWQWDTEVREANLRGDAMRALQTQHTIKALQAAGLNVNVDESALAKATASLIQVPQVDVQKLASALAAAGAGSDVNKIAAAVEATLKDDFANIPKAVNDNAADRMKS